MNLRRLEWVAGEDGRIGAECRLERAGSRFLRSGCELNYGVLVDAATVDGSRLPVMAVIKADAYGHGVEICAPVLVQSGARWLGVMDAEEGVRVRDAVSRTLGPGKAGPRILVMCGMLPGDAGALVENGLTAVVWTAEQIRWLASAARACGTEAEVHLEIDTGMSRQGVVPGEPLDRLLEEARRWPEVRITGVMTHFASAEVAGSPVTLLQRARFESALEQIGAGGLHVEWMHVGNTSTVDEGSALPWLAEAAERFGARPMARAGLGLYGYSLPLQGAEGCLRRLQPVLTWRSQIVALEELEPGAAIGYNSTFTAARKMRVALVPVGYADGLRRELSSTDARPGGWVMVRGRRAPIVGRISMNLTTVDVSGISEVIVGDEVMLLGDGVSAQDHAELAGTIAYEILCGLRVSTRRME